MKNARSLSTVYFHFDDGRYVKWIYLGMQQRLYRPEKRYAVQGRVENGPESIDVAFETWDKPSEARAVLFIKSAIREAENFKSPHNK